jgi:hypothetical protein
MFRISQFRRKRQVRQEGPGEGPLCIIIGARQEPVEVSVRIHAVSQELAAGEMQDGSPPGKLPEADLGPTQRVIRLLTGNAPNQLEITCPIPSTHYPTRSYS